MTGLPPVLVTGATGFLGRHVCAELARSGAPVRALVRPGSNGLPKGVEAFPWSGMDDGPAVERAIHGAGAVVHLAARVHVLRDRDADPAAAYRRANVDGTRLLLDAARSAGVRRFVLASSVKVMGEANDRPWRESDAPAPADAYGATKLEAERLVLHEAGEGVVLRLPLVYGAGMKANMLSLFRLVDRGLPLPFGAIRNRRSLAYAGNVTAAVRDAVGCAAAAGQVFFVSDGEDVSTPALVRAVAAALRRPARLFHVPESAFRAVGRVGDRLSRFGVPVTSDKVDRLLGSLSVDSARLREVTGHSPPFSLAEGLEVTARWYRTVREGTR